ncbi:MAG: hypothetical protein EOR84_22845 [Mesorhizobium sp.]|uniref:hypothetical protein n=1 Tax=Mesorhizobium sp. TaxID=1871066 RepID=UPI000FE9E24B|nr:hypothetical protein [Mesorhizobium sp.]RWM90050.1 MAG: hypothetical protein EOR84_22845 [Mesorhizobium sp.]
MTTALLLRRKAEETTRDAARYEQLQRAQKWLKEYESGNDLTPLFGGHNASSCDGFKDVVALLNELGKNRMKDFLKELKQLAWDELRELDKKYG